MPIKLNLFIIYILINFFLTFFFYYFSKIIKLVDKPDHRKFHSGNIPLIGGLVIYFSLLIIIQYLDLDYFQKLIFYSSSIIVFFGLLDDILHLGVKIRLISQLMASSIIVGGGLSIIDIGDYYYFSVFNLGIFGIMLTIFSILGLTNAINFIDGTDGVCSILVIVALISLISYFQIYDLDNKNSEILFYLLISLFIFLFFNFSFLHKFKIFLGDSGSTFLGFIVGWELIYYTRPEIRLLHPILVLWTISIPFFDIIRVLIKRIFNKKNIFDPDRTHIHHLLISNNYSVMHTNLILLFFATFFSVIGGITFYLFGPAPNLIIYILCFFTYLLIIKKYFKS